MATTGPASPSPKDAPAASYWREHLKTLKGQWAPILTLIELANDEQAFGHAARVAQRLGLAHQGQLGVVDARQMDRDGHGESDARGQRHQLVHGGVDARRRGGQGAVEAHQLRPCFVEVEEANLIPGIQHGTLVSNL